MSHYSDKHYIPNDNFDKVYYNLFFKKGDKILDIGCSTGNFLVQDTTNTQGLDADRDAIKIAKKRGLNAIQHDVKNKLPFKDSTIENIHCRHLLEHLDNPLSFMKEAFRVLKKKGRFVLITDKYSERFWDDYTHERPFTKKSLELIAYDAGFRRFRIYNFPTGGVFGAGFLYEQGIISSTLLKKIYDFFGRFFKQDGLILDAIK